MGRAEELLDRIAEIREGRSFWGALASGILLYRRETAEFLLLKRSNSMNSGTWGIPGGRVDYGDPKKSAIKEANEEIGGLPGGEFGTWNEGLYEFRLELTELDRVAEGSGEERHYRPGRPGEYFRYITYLYLVDDLDWEPELNWEHSDHGWFSYGDQPDNTVSLRDKDGRRVYPVVEAIKHLVFYE